MRFAAATLTLATLAVLALFTGPLATAQVPFPNCADARAAGAVNIPRGDPRYGPDLDADADGVACEDANRPGGAGRKPAPAPVTQDSGPVVTH